MAATERSALSCHETHGLLKLGGRCFSSQAGVRGLAGAWGAGEAPPAPGSAGEACSQRPCSPPCGSGTVGGQVTLSSGDKLLC